MEVALLELCPELKDPKLLARVEADEKRNQQQTNSHEQSASYNSNSQRPVMKEREGQSSDEEDHNSARPMQRTTGSGAESGEETN